MQPHPATQPATQDHPNILGAQAAIRSLRQARYYALDAVEPSREYRSEQAPDLRTAASRSIAHARLLRAERGDRVVLAAQGLAPDVPSPAPANLAVVAATDHAEDTAVDMAWILSSHLRLRPLLVYGLAWQYPYPTVWDAATGYLLMAIRYASPDVADEVGSALHHADTMLRAALGVGTDRLPVHAPCPACGWRRLTAEVSSPERSEWTVTCEHPRCVCRGLSCGCGRPGTVGARHVWPAAHWGRLEQLLGRTRTGVAA